MIEIKDKMGNRLTGDQIKAKSRNRVYNILLDFELMLLRWVGHIPFHSVRRMIYTAVGVRMGKGSVIHMWCNFFKPGNIDIGEDTIIGDHAFLDGRAKLTIGSHVDIASSVLIYNSQHDTDSDDFRAKVGRVTIEDYVFVGPRVIILPDVTIGEGAIVAAGAVVTDNVPPFMMAGGIPARIIGKRKNTSPHYKLGRARLFQ